MEKRFSLKKKSIALIMTALMLALFSMTAFGVHLEPGRTGSLTLKMQSNGQIVPGGEVKLYHVGSITETQSGFAYAWTGDFSSFGAAPDDLQSEALAVSVASYASSVGASGKACKVGPDGKAFFEDLEQGLYLVVQVKAAQGYLPINPFFISIPIYEDDVYVYDVDASPKFELAPETTQQTSVSEPFETTTTEATNTTLPSDITSATTVPGESQSQTTTGSASSEETTAAETLPVTGQLNWPIPMLAFAGLFFVVVGLMICGGKKTYEDEN